MAHARLVKMNDGSLAFFSSYDSGLVADLKAQIPPSERRWDGVKKAWMVAAQWGDKLADLADFHLGVRPHVPVMDTTIQTATRLVQLDYLGTAKDRGGEYIAFGWCDDGWNLAFPLDVLRRWFEPDDEKPDSAPTLYGVLGIRRDVVPADLKQAYRRAAKQWHPDLCDEPDAKEQFQRIQYAYEVLSDHHKRAKYDAGLKLAASVGKPIEAGLVKRDGAYRPPLRCGLLLIEGISSLGRITVKCILQWDDVVNAQGRTMVSYWPRGGEHFKTRWV